ncbi:MAG: hypothetical protein OXU54_00885 [Gammaproteobacteria bacterium]|nr:hypothetical protein [Gammaproteobacteria bacterium]
MNVLKAVQESKPDERRLILLWIIKSGPFIDTDRQEEPEDYFEFEGQDVTDSGLGEAARRERIGDSSGVFSFAGGGPINFERTPLTVLHGIPEERLGDISVGNIWDVQELESRLRENRVARNWAELIEICQERFNLLEIPNYIPESTYLAKEAFCRTVADGIERRLDILHQIMSGRSVSDGQMTDDAHRLWQKHSQGDRAWFSDESARNKQRFRQELEFKDPSDPSRLLFCPWHGKINRATFRIHFEWPVPPGQARLKVLYIGRKITRR